MIGKDVYPYDYMNNQEKFEETKLPPRSAFYSKLNVKGISNNNYEHTQHIWNAMRKKALCQYRDTYLKTRWEMYLRPSKIHA